MSVFKRRIAQLAEDADALIARRWADDLSKLAPLEIAAGCLQLLYGSADYDVWREKRPEYADYTDEQLQEHFIAIAPGLIAYLRDRSVDMVRRRRPGGR